MNHLKLQKIDGAKIQTKIGKSKHPNRGGCEAFMCASLSSHATAQYGRNNYNNFVLNSITKWLVTLRTITKKLKGVWVWICTKGV